MMRAYIAVTTIFLAIVTSVSASQSSPVYECKIFESKTVKNNGRLLETEFDSLMVGGKFSVVKDSGRVWGVLDNSGAFGQTSVLDKGGESQSYKAVTIYKPFVAVNGLSIAEFEKGREKSFLWFEMGSQRVITGICVSS
jgi:hypothetical protein